MSGHSKWANIKHKKSKQDVQKGKAFTRLTKEITVSAKEGGGDPDGNARLRLLIEKAKAANMPNDNISRAIKKGTGELAGVTYEAMRYEGYGPGGMAIILDVLTDNKNRTVSELRHCFSRYGGNLAETGSVSWMFERKAELIIKTGDKSEDEILEFLLNYDIDDFIYNKEGSTVICASEDLEKVKKGLEQSRLVVESAEISWITKDPIELVGESEEKAYKLLEAILKSI